MSLNSALCGAGCVMLGSWLWKQIRRLAFKDLAGKDTSEERRKACPPSVDMSANYMPGCFEVDAASKELKNERGFFTLRSGQNIFYQTWAPVTGDVSGVVIIIHGFGDHCDFTQALKAKTLCGMGRFAAAAFDLPGHGRSDGALAHVADWFEFVDAAREVIVEHLQPLMRQRFPMVKIFGMGESMGGGVLFSLLAREKEIFDGAILVCPMLFVSREMFPPKIVELFFKHVLVSLLPLWPVAPNKDISDLCWEDPKMRAFMNGGAVDHGKIICGSAKPRLITASQLAFTAGEWMKSKIPEYDTPSLIIHGGGDVVTDHRVSEQLFKDMQNKDKQFLYPPGVWHADLFHGGPTQYDGCRERFEAVKQWLEAHCS